MKTLGYAIGFVVLMAALYVGAYYAMLGDRFVCWAIPGSEAEPIYRFWQDSSDWFFGPAHEIDKMLRPDYWTPKEMIAD